MHYLLVNGQHPFYYLESITKLSRRKVMIQLTVESSLSNLEWCFDLTDNKFHYKYEEEKYDQRLEEKVYVIAVNLYAYVVYN